jgi:hypothetical protein
MDHDFVEARLFVMAKVLNDLHRTKEVSVPDGLAFENITICATPKDIQDTELLAVGILKDFVHTDKAVAVHLGIWIGILGIKRFGGV